VRRRRTAPPALAWLLGAAAALALWAAHPARAAEPGLVWETAFLDEFEGPAGALPSSAVWRFSVGHGYPGGPPNWGTGEVAYHTDDPANVSLDGDGRLLITPLRDAEGGWTSARIETNRSDFRPPPGAVMRIEGRIAMPAVTGGAALGYWPAFWALGSPYRQTFGWPAVGEIDVMESVNGLDQNWGVLHCGIASGGPCNEPEGIGAVRACTPDPCVGHFRTYAFEWDARSEPGELRWYLDGEPFHSVSEAHLPAEAWADIASHEGFFLILNVAIGGGFPSGVAQRQTPTGETEPGHPMVVDYVAVRYGRPAPPDEEEGPGETPPGEPRLALAAKPRSKVVPRRTRRVTFRALLRNTGDVGAGEVKVCARTKRRLLALRGKACRVARIPAGGERSLRFTFGIRRAAAGKRVKIRLVANGDEVRKRTTTATLRVKR